MTLKIDDAKLIKVSFWTDFMFWISGTMCFILRHIFTFNEAGKIVYAALMWVFSWWCIIIYRNIKERNLKKENSIEVGVDKFTYVISILLVIAIPVSMSLHFIFE